MRSFLHFRSWIFFKEGNEVSSVLFSSQTSEWHFVTGDVFTWIQQINKQMLFTPIEACAFQCFTGWEIGASSLSADDSSKSWSCGIFVITLRLINKVQLRHGMHHSFLRRRLFLMRHHRLEVWHLVIWFISSFYHPFWIYW